jgi:hypothetical protein
MIAAADLIQPPQEHGCGSPGDLLTQRGGAFDKMAAIVAELREEKTWKECSLGPLARKQYARLMNGGGANRDCDKLYGRKWLLAKRDQT